jgi:hypothetical protein
MVGMVEGCKMLIWRTWVRRIGPGIEGAEEGEHDWIMLRRELSVSVVVARRAMLFDRRL